MRFTSKTRSSGSKKTLSARKYRIGGHRYAKFPDTRLFVSRVCHISWLGPRAGAGRLLRQSPDTNDQTRLGNDLPFGPHSGRPLPSPVFLPT